VNHRQKPMKWQCLLRKLNALPSLDTLDHTRSMLVQRICSALSSPDNAAPYVEFFGRFMIIALMSPAFVIFASPWIGWLMKRRRSYELAALGLAFAFAIYVIDMEGSQPIPAEVLGAGTGPVWCCIELVFRCRCHYSTTRRCGLKQAEAICSGCIFAPC